jgi:hypothetical protein
MVAFSLLRFVRLPIESVRNLTSLSAYFLISIQKRGPDIADILASVTLDVSSPFKVANRYPSSLQMASVYPTM